uniref:Uncharacterized protein n=1 Tax=Anguilla anguilla TaxID=7936 RepID=A0A0E9P7K4_ANGAN
MLLNPCHVFERGGSPSLPGLRTMN